MLRNKALFSKYNGILLGIILIGLALRIYGITFGKPFLYHIDEWKLVNQAGHLLDIKHWTKDTFFHIGTYPPFFTYLLAISFAVYSFFGLVIGYFDSIGSIVVFYKSNPFTFHLIGRFLSALFGTLAIPVVYLVGKRLFDRRVGLIGALFIALTFIHVRNSHYSTVDIPATFFTVLAFLFIVQVYLKGNLLFYILAGLFSGLAISTKYNTGLIVVPLLLSHFLKAKELGIRTVILDKRIYIGLGTLIFSFLISCPLPLIDFHRFIQGVLKISGSEKMGRVGYYSGEGFFSYITGKQWPGFYHFARNSFSGALGWPLMILSICGTFLGILRLSRKNILFLSFPLLLFLYLSHLNYKAMRHMLPIIPFLVILAALFLCFLAERLPMAKKWKDRILVLLVIGIGFPMAVDSIRHDRWLTLTETRTLAKEWIEAHIPPGTAIAIESYAPQLYNLNEEYPTIGPRIVKQGAKIRGLGDDTSQVKAYFLVYTGWDLFSYGPDRPVEFDPIEQIRRYRVRYIILDDFTYNRFYLKSAVERYPIKTGQRQRFYQWVRDNCTLVKVFDPRETGGPGPRLEIYEVPETLLESHAYK